MLLQSAPRSGRLTLTLTLAIALILAIGLALASYLDEANFRRAHTQLAVSRMLVPTQDLHRLIESSMDFGLALTQLTTLPQRLQSMLDEDTDLIGIMIYDPFGQLVFHAAQEDAVLPERMPGDWPHGTEQDAWHLAQPDRYLLGMGFRNSFNQPAGILVLAYDRARVDAPVVLMRAALVRNLALTQAIMTLLVAIGSYWLVRPLRAELYAAKACGGGLERPDEAHTPAHPVSDMLANVMAFAAASNRALRRIAQALAGGPRDDSPAATGSSTTLDRALGLDRFNRRILLFALLLILSGIGLLSYLTLLDFRQEFEPALHRKAEVIGDSLRRMLLFLDAYGVQPQFLSGLDDHFETIRAHHPEVGYLVLVDPSGQIQAAAGTIPEQIRADLQARTDGSVGPVAIQSDIYVDTPTPVQRASGLPIGDLHVGQERRFIDRQMTEIGWDLGTVALVSMLIAFELLLFAIAFLVHVPLSAVARLAREVCAGNFAARISVRARNEFGQLAVALNARLDHVALVCREAWAQATTETARAALVRLRDQYAPDRPEGMQTVTEDRLILIRWPFFLFIFAESLSLSFFPLYVKQLYTPIPGWSQELVLGLPISIFMLVWALSLPAGGAWSDRVGRRRAFLTGALVAGVGLALTATAQGIWDLILWRSLTALGYGIVFITAQGYVVDYTPAAQRTRGMAMFLATFFGGSLCGAAIGGILAERIGYAPVFWLSALLALIAAAVAGRFLIPPAGVSAAAPSRLRLGNLWDLLRNPRFMAVTLLTAIPAKLILTGFLYYAMPLYLTTLALNAGDVGRVMMTYGLAMILLSPLVGYLADAWGRRAGFVIVGGLLAALAILLLELKASVLLAVFGITLLGAAQAIGVSPQLSLVMDVSRAHSERMGAGTVMGIFRLLERLGNVLGPIVLALLIGALGFDGAFMALGLYALLSVMLFALIWFAFARRDRRLASAPASMPSGLGAAETATA